LQYGTEAQQQDVVNHCATAEPHHGEVWQRVAKVRLAALQVDRLAGHGMIGGLEEWWAGGSAGW